PTGRGPPRGPPPGAPRQGEIPPPGAAPRATRPARATPGAARPAGAVPHSVRPARASSFEGRDRSRVEGHSEDVLISLKLLPVQREVVAPAGGLQRAGAIRERLHS